MTELCLIDKNARQVQDGLSGQPSWRPDTHVLTVEVDLSIILNTGIVFGIWWGGVCNSLDHCVLLKFFLHSLTYALIVPFEEIWGLLLGLHPATDK